MKNTNFILRDLSKGVIRQSAISNFLTPENSVSHSLNLNYDQVIGSAILRPGTTLLGTTVASGKTPLGLYNYVSSGNILNLMVAVYSGAATATIYYYDGSWHTSGTTTLNNTAKNRFSQLGNRIFRVNGVDAMTSSSDGNTWATTDCITTDGVIPSLIFRSKSRFLCAGYTGFRDRVYFSSVINPNSSPFITWNTNPSTGDWIDVNPDDGSNITAFAETSSTTLIFKANNMYRVDVISKTVDTQNIFNIGAVSQESMVLCQGVVYFFSGIDIRSTVGDYPQQLSRLGVQDFIDAIPQANWSSVAAGTDGLNVYFDIGTVTINTNQNEQKTYTNVTLKFSPRDQTWSVHSYANQFMFNSQYKTSAGYTMVGADTAGNVQTRNSGLTDNGTPIFFELESQDLEFGDRATTKQTSDAMIAFIKNGIDSQIEIKSDLEKDYKPVVMDLSNRVNIGKSIPVVQGHFLKVRWSGETSGTAPMFEGIYMPDITDQGYIN